MLEDLKEQWEATPLWQKIFLLAIFPLVMIGIFWFYMVNPKINEKNELLQKKEELNTEITRYRLLLIRRQDVKLEEELKSLLEKERKMKEELRVIAGYLPSTKDLDRVFLIISEKAYKNNVIILGVRVSEKKSMTVEVINTAYGKFVREVKEEEKEEKKRKRKKKDKEKEKEKKTVKQPKGVPISYVDIEMSVSGEMKNIYGFLKDLYLEGFVSFPRSISLEREGDGRIKASIVLSVVIQE